MKRLLLAFLLLVGMGVESKAQIPPNTVFLYTYVGTALPTRCNNGDAFFNVLIYVRYTCGPINTWIVWAGGSGGTAPVTSNFISGDGAGSFANSGVAVTAAGIISLFSSCSPTTGKFLGANGVCTVPPGGGTIPSTTSALKGDGAGNASAVTGTGSNCVHVDGSSAACGGAGGFTQSATGATGSIVITAGTHGQGTSVTGSCFDGTGLNISCSATTNFGNGTVTFSIPADVPFTGTFLIK